MSIRAGTARRKPCATWPEPGPRFYPATGKTRLTTELDQGAPDGGAVAAAPPNDRELSALLDDIVRRFAGSIRATGARYRLPPSDIGDAEQEVRIRLWRVCGTPENISQALGVLSATRGHDGSPGSAAPSPPRGNARPG